MTKQASKFSGKKLDELYSIYDEARRIAKEAENDKTDAANNIKDLLGDIEEASTSNYIVTYAYDKDKDIEVFNEELFMTKDPKGYKKYEQLNVEIQNMRKKYTKKTTVKGARKLIVTAKAE